MPPTLPYLLPLISIGALSYNLESWIIELALKLTAKIAIVFFPI